jgi:ribosomal protein S20
MKKIITSSILALSIAGFMAGCDKNQPAPTQNFQQCTIEGSQAPSWVCDGGATMEGGLFGVGSAEKNPMGISFQRTEAAAAARDALARQLKVKVKNMFKQFQATTGIGDAQTAEKATQNVSKQIAQATLSGSKIMKTWVSPKGTLFVLVGMPDPKAVANQVKQVAKTTFKNDQALWQEFKAKKADQELEAAVEKEFGSK